VIRRLRLRPLMLLASPAIRPTSTRVSSVGATGRGAPPSSSPAHPATRRICRNKRYENIARGRRETYKTPGFCVSYPRGRGRPGEGDSYPGVLCQYFEARHRLEFRHWLRDRRTTMFPRVAHHLPAEEEASISSWSAREAPSWCRGARSERRERRPSMVVGETRRSPP